MSEPFIAEIRMMSFAFAPRGWAQCNGQLLPIAQNQALFSLIGTAYGGNGTTTFALPDLQGRTPLHPGSASGGPSHARGEKSGQEQVTLSTAQMPQHVHMMSAAEAPGTSASPANAFFAEFETGYEPFGVDTVSLEPSMIGPAGGNQPHQNMQPYLTINFCIALQGIYPSRN